MKSLIWFDSKHRIGRARLTGAFSAEEGPGLFCRFKKIFKGKEPCNLLVDIEDGGENFSDDFFDWLEANAAELNLDKIAVVETCSCLHEERELRRTHKKEFPGGKR